MDNPLAVVPRMMVQGDTVPVLVLEFGWFDHGYGAGPLGGDYACLADLGHVIEPRVLPGHSLSTFEEAAARLKGYADEARRRADEERTRAGLYERKIQRLRRYALANGCDW